MARGADRVARCPQFGGVGIVTVTARHALVVHAALSERAVDVYLILNLSVHEIETVLERQGEIFVERCLAGVAPIGDLYPPRVARGAGPGGSHGAWLQGLVVQAQGSGLVAEPIRFHRVPGQGMPREEKQQQCEVGEQL